MTFKNIKHNFEQELWTVAMVLKAYQKGVISAEEFTLITSQPLEEPTTDTEAALEVLGVKIYED